MPLWNQKSTFLIFHKIPFKLGGEEVVTTGIINRITIFLKDENGTSSVLVIFMMLVLVTLGAFTITSANANYKLSQRSLEWNKMYYLLDSEGETNLAQIDAKLAEAEEMAYEYIKNQKYASLRQTELPDEMQKQIYSIARSDDFFDKHVSDVANNVYMYYSSVYLNSLAKSNFEVNIKKDEFFIDSINVFITLKSDRPNETMCSLRISVKVEPIEYAAVLVNGSVSLVRVNNNLRYKIEDWCEFQEY